MLVTLAACGLEVPERLAPPPPPHEAYANALRDAGLGETALGRLWEEAARAALHPDAPSELPLASDLAFEAHTPEAWGARLPLRRGEVLHIAVMPAPGDSARLFVDLFAATDSTTGRLLTGELVQGDTLHMEHRAEADGPVLLRLQPELLMDLTMALRIETAPSLAFPVSGFDERAIRSGWGAPRDGGARSHQGVDIFAPRGTPAVASAAGRVTRVQETPIGGRVVWLRPEGFGASLYYAHLDSQRVRTGDRVAPGDTLGFVGNTGNARSTPPHLHFGVYTRGGAVDPYPFLVGRRAGPRIADAATEWAARAGAR